MEVNLVRSKENSASKEFAVYSKAQETAKWRWQLGAIHNDFSSTLKLELKPFDRDSRVWSLIKDLFVFDLALQPTSEPTLQLEVSGTGGKNDGVAYPCSSFPEEVAKTAVNRSALDEQLRQEFDIRFISYGETRPEQIMPRKQIQWPLAEAAMLPAEVVGTAWCRTELQNARWMGNVRTLRFLDGGIVDHKRIIVTPERGGNYEITSYDLVPGAAWAVREDRLFLNRTSSQSIEADPLEIHVMQDKRGQKILTTSAAKAQAPRPGEVFLECESYRDEDKKFHFFDMALSADEFKAFLDIKGNQKIPIGWR